MDHITTDKIIKFEVFLMDLLYALGGRGSARTMLGFFYTMYKFDCLRQELVTEKYYKGTQSLLYFPYVRPKFKEVSLVKRKTKPYGYDIGEIYFDEFMWGDRIQKSIIEMAKED